MALETQVGQLVAATTALQATVSSELTKVRAENAAFKATVISASSSASQNAEILVFDGFDGRVAKNSGAVFAHSNHLILKDSLGSGAGDFQMGSGKIPGFLLNVAIGHNTLSTNTSGLKNTAVGGHALWVNTTGQYNTAVGAGVLRDNITGNGNTGVGAHAMFSGTNVNSKANANTTAVGCGALNLDLALTNSAGFGFNAQVTGNNQVQLGDSATTVYCYNSVQSRSDKRDKTDIRPTALGLDFIKHLNPVDYRWDMREFYRPQMPQPLTGNVSESDNLAYESALVAWQEAIKFENLKPDGSKKKNRYHHGLIAQEVEALIKSTGKDFGGFQDHKRSGGQDVLSIGYDELIAPLIKAVQELAQMNEELRARISTLESAKP